MKVRSYSFHLKDFVELFPGGVNENTPVSTLSTFGEPVWQLFDPENERMKAYTPGQLEIVWPEYDAMPEPMVDFLRLFAFLYLKAPALVIQNQKRTAGNHPTTVVGLVPVGRSNSPTPGHLKFPHL
jgi:hypothetical protein